MSNLTKREHFSMAAMGALISNTDAIAAISKEAKANKADFKKTLSYVAVVYADSLIDELNRTAPECDHKNNLLRKCDGCGRPVT